MLLRPAVDHHQFTGGEPANAEQVAFVVRAIPLLRAYYEIVQGQVHEVTQPDVEIFAQAVDVGQGHGAPEIIPFLGAVNRYRGFSGQVYGGRREFLPVHQSDFAGRRPEGSGRPVAEVRTDGQVVPGIAVVVSENQGLTRVVACICPVDQYVRVNRIIENRCEGIASKVDRYTAGVGTIVGWTVSPRDGECDIQEGVTVEVAYRQVRPGQIVCGAALDPHIGAAGHVDAGGKVTAV